MAAARCTWALLLLLPAVAWAGGAGPVLLNRPFVTIWNAPTKACAEKYNVTLDLSVFDIVANAEQDFAGDDVTIFYSQNLGLYPYYTSAGTPVDGGLPQNASLQAHLHQASSDIETALPSASYNGLAVIDWEAWRPLWARDWDAMNIYREKSEDLVRKAHPLWPSSLVKEVAKLEFEKSARAFMEQTLKLGEQLRPSGYWGFYGFPDCYNNDFDSKDYTGKCPLIEQARNKELFWLWRNSRALYPSIYLPQQLSGTNKVLNYVRHRVAEAFSVQDLVVNGSIPVLPYAQITFENTDVFLSEEDLVNTIGESAAQGAAGVVLWGSLSYSSSQEMCLKLKNYLDGDLGHYILNVTTSAELCSQKLCSGQGRCVRKKTHSGFLHLDPFNFAIEKDSSNTHLEVGSSTSSSDSSQLADEFTCQCYDDWKGAHCDTKAA
ncbi:hyaluronidase-1 [Nothoprocta perdicaria]|uniref:hyaluronidase-1 n=1 Tax=Nothoprocta perdicaria TaxID=30464 RepID=UPI000E1C2F7B|nr:hyaluronidase-1 [Nothoprocta perdicaria]